MSSVLIRGSLVAGHGHVDLLVEGNRIAAIGHGLQAGSAEIVEAPHALLWPGLVNTHHHLAQSLLKGLPSGIDLGLDDWLGAVPYKAWPHYTPEHLYHAACAGLLELLRSGCTLCADHHYLYHAETSAEMEEAVFQAASDVGIRLLLCRGMSTTRGSHTGMRSTSLEPETLQQCVARLEASITRFHDDAPDAMQRVAVAPTSLMHACPPEHLRELAAFARDKQLLRHSHLLEIARDDLVAREQHGLSAVDYAASVEWLEEGVWFAHLVNLSAAEVQQVAAAGVGMAHCPVSNCRLGSGIAPAPALEEGGALVSLGVDGAASAENSSLVNEMMMAWLVHRAVGGSSASSVDQVMRWATCNGADLLGFGETGRLQVGGLADLVLYDLDQPRFSGLARPEWAPVICGEPVIARDVMVNGQWRLRGGEPLGLDQALATARARQSCQALLNAL
ncbi:MAG: amidohydrolase family protein [Pseudomonadota bacterium]